MRLTVVQAPARTVVRLQLTRGPRQRVTLVIRTRTSARPGRYRVVIRARSGRVKRTLTLTLTIVAPPSGSAAAGQSPPFSISGDVASPLEPGAPQPLDLQIANPNSVPLTIDHLDAAVQSVNAPQANPTLPCALSNFTVQQFSGSLPLVIPPSSTMSLSQLGVAPSSWPQVALLDLPTNQDGCQGASLTLAYQAAARLG